LLVESDWQALRQIKRREIIKLIAEYGFMKLNLLAQFRKEGLRIA
jgi:hypothetical protein